MSEIQELKELVEGTNRDFKEFRRKNDERIDALAKNKGVGELDETLAKINTAIDEKAEKSTKLVTELKERIDTLETAAKRPSTYVPDGRGGVKELTLETAEQKEHRKAIDTYSRTGQGLENLRALEQKALVRGSDPQGGYWVPDVVSSMIVKKNFETSPMRQICGQLTIGVPAFVYGTDLNQITPLWEGELENNGETAAPEVGIGRIVAHTLRARPQASQELLEDASVDVEGWLGGKASDAFSRGENLAFVTGDGIRRPRGFASYTTAATSDATRAWGVFEHVATAANGSFGSTTAGSDKCIQLVHAMKATLRGGCTWVMGKLALGAARQLKTSGGNYIWVPAADVSAVLESPILSTSGRLLGYPILEAEDMAAYTTTDALAVAFGNFREGYMIVDRLGISLLRDPYTVEPQVKFVYRKRVGGDVMNFECIKFIKFGS